MARNSRYRERPSALLAANVGIMLLTGRPEKLVNASEDIIGLSLARLLNPSQSQGMLMRKARSLYFTAMFNFVLRFRSEPGADPILCYLGPGRGVIVTDGQQCGSGILNVTIVRFGKNGNGGHV